MRVRFPPPGFNSRDAACHALRGIEDAHRVATRLLESVNYGRVVGVGWGVADCVVAGWVVAPVSLASMFFAGM